MASSCDHKRSGKGREVTRELENRERRESFLQEFFVAILNEDETKVGHNKAQRPEEAAERPQNEDTRNHLVSELQTLDRDRKKSFVVRVIDGLLSRLDHSESEMSTGNIEDDVAEGRERDKNEAGAIYCKQETELRNAQREGTKGVCTRVHTNKVKKTKLGIDKEDRIDNDAEELVLTKYRHRGSVCHIQNLGSQYDGGDEVENGNPCDPSCVRKQIKSVAFSPSVSQTDKKSNKVCQLDRPEKKHLVITGAERKHVHLQHQRTDSEENGLPSPLPPNRPTMRRPKTVKDWLIDPNVYQVYCIVVITDDDSVFCCTCMSCISNMQPLILPHLIISHSINCRFEVKNACD